MPDGAKTRMGGRSVDVPHRRVRAGHAGARDARAGSLLHPSEGRSGRGAATPLGVPPGRSGAVSCPGIEALERPMRGAALWMLAFVLGAWVLPAGVAAGDAGFDLDAYRVLAASDRAAGIAEGRRLLAGGRLRGDAANRRRVLWFMGGAAIALPDVSALHDVLAELDAMADRGDAAAGGLAGFLRGARHLDEGALGPGLIAVLDAANAVDPADAEMRRIAASELCRGYVNAGQPAQAVPHCRRHTRLLADLGDRVALGRALYLEASATSLASGAEQAIPLWRQSLDHFSAGDAPLLAARAAGSLATDLNRARRHAEALDMAERAAAAAQGAGNVSSHAIALGAVAEALQGLGRGGDARATVERALALVEPLDAPHIRLSLLAIRADLLQAALADDPTLADALAAVRAELAGLDPNAPGPGQAAQISSLEQTLAQREEALRIRELEQENLRRELEIEASRQQAAQAALAERQAQWMRGLWAGATVALVLLLAAMAWALHVQRTLARVLRDQAYRDALTRLPNRRALTERLAQLSAAEARGHALLLADIDHFKQVNDRHGHPAGDQVLSAVADRLAAGAGPHDVVARLGGEEFAVLAAAPDAVAAGALAERLRAAIAAVPVTLSDGTRIAVTVSIGVAPMASLDGPQAWLSAADHALYAAKRGGRNRCVVSAGA